MSNAQQVRPNSQPREFVSLVREACQCRYCFENLELSAPTIAIAQPRWVGPKYWGSKKKILIVTLNPGSGEQRKDTADTLMYERLKKFRDDPEDDLRQVLQLQANDMANWGRRRFWHFYFDGLGLNLNEVALANVAWCATAGNNYPRQMLDQCFTRFTSRLIRLLKPTHVLLSGSNVGIFGASISRMLPSAHIITMMHYAHREGHVAGDKELQRVRERLAMLSSPESQY